MAGFGLHSYGEFLSSVRGDFWLGIIGRDSKTNRVFMLTSFGFFVVELKGCCVNSSKLVGRFLDVLSLNRLFLNRFIKGKALRALQEE